MYKTGNTCAVEDTNLAQKSFQQKQHHHPKNPNNQLTKTPQNPRKLTQKEVEWKVCASYWPQITHGWMRSL